MSCHASVPSARFTIAGTVYAGPASTAPVRGATIRIADAEGTIFDLVSATNGNFYTTLPVVFPVKVGVSLCPADVSMMAPVNGGSCNSCHGVGFRIHVP